jgi:hypothetical protein
MQIVRCHLGTVWRRGLQRPYLLPERFYLRASKPVLLPVQVDAWLKFVLRDFSFRFFHVLKLYLGSILMRLSFFTSPKIWVSSYFVVFSISLSNSANNNVAFIFTFKILVSACPLC